MPSEPSNETIKVLGAGFGRTGTTSLKDALNILGFKCYHMQEIVHRKVNRKSHPDLWIEAANGQIKDYDVIFKENQGDEPYRATVDWPSTRVWEDIWKQYPNAKIILTERDSESWYKSAKTTIYSVANTFPVCYVIPRGFTRMVFHIIWTGTFNSRFEDKQYAIDVYEKHNQRVKQIVPKDRLLVLDVTKGEGNHWKQLCEFLEVPEPQVPFPRSNDTKYALNMIKKGNILGWTVILAGTSVLAAVMGVALYFYF